MSYATTRYTVTELLGDGISAELAQSIRIVAQRFPFELQFDSVDLSLENRQRRGSAVYDQAVESIQQHRLALKYPTVTKHESPNAVLRERCEFSVIHRPVATLPGLPTNFKRSLDLDIIRVARGGTYDDPGRRLGRNSAVSLRIVERQPCWEAARFAFRLAQRRGQQVTTASKYTIQEATDGLFEEIASEVAADFPTVTRQQELFDALLAKLVLNPERYGVILVLNEYGDFLSDLACGLVGSMGLGASSSLAFDDQGDVRYALFDPAGGTAPDIAGKNLCNPTAALLALSLLLAELGEAAWGDVLRHSVLETLAEGRRTRDLGGTLGTIEFSETVALAMGAHALATVG